MKGAAGWGHGEASLAPTAGGPAGRSAAASEGAGGGGWGRLRLARTLQGMRVFSQTQCDQAAPGPQRPRMP